MSASKKKLQRREAVDTKKVNQAQAEHAAYKKKVRLYTIIGVVVAVLVAALLIWNTGVFQKNATAATVGEEKLTVGELSYYYYNNYYRYLYSYYGINDTDVFDSSTGKTYGDYYLELALSDAQSAIAFYDAAIAAGHTDAEVAENVAAQIASMKSAASTNGYSYKAYLKATMGEFMTPAIFETQLTHQLLAELYYSEISDADYNSYTAADLEAYYAENTDSVDTFNYSYLYFTPATVDTKDADGNTLSDEKVAELKDAALAAAKSKAEKALALYENGSTITDLILDCEPSTSADHIGTAGISSVSSVYRDKLLEMNADEAILVENGTSGYYVVIYHGRERNESLTANVRHILVLAETTTDAEGKVVAPTDEAWNAALAKAESILAEYKAGTMNADSFAALANKYSEDTGSNTTGGLYENIASTDGYVPEFLDWIFDETGRQSGDTGIVRHEGDTATSNPYWGYHVMYLDHWGEAEWQLDVRSALSTASLNEWYEGVIENYTAALSNGAKHVAG